MQGLNIYNIAILRALAASVALAGLSSTTALWAQSETAPPLLPVVKIRSFQCEQEGQIAKYRQGSGILVRAGATAYVLTSSHVPLHEDRADEAPSLTPLAICQRLTTANGTTFHAQMRGANFLKDLALLVVTPPSDAAVNTEWTDLMASALPLEDADLWNGTIAAGTPVVLRGFPVASAPGSAPNLDRGTVSAAANARTSLDVPALIEVDGMSEYGMSGGGAFTADGHLVGMLSAQYLKINEGTSTTIGEMSTATRGPMRTLVLPALELRTWVQQLLNGEPGADLRLDAQLLATRAQRGLSLGGFLFIERGCTSGPQIGGGHAVGIGGGHAVGIGGGDGSGSAEPSSCHVVITRDSSATRVASQPWPWQNTRSLTRIQLALAEAGPVYMQHLLDADTHLPVENLQRALTRLRDGYSPILTYAAPDESDRWEPIVLRGSTVEQWTQYVADLVRREQDQIRDLTTQLSQSSPEQIEQIWNEADARRRLLIYSTVRSADALSREQRFQILRLTFRHVNTLQGQARQIQGESGSQSALERFSSDEQAWLTTTAQVLYEGWLRLSSDERRRMFVEGLPTGRAKCAMVNALQIANAPAELQNELTEISRPYAEAELSAWNDHVASGDHRDYWRHAGFGRRAWIFMAAQIYATQYPQLLEAVREVCPRPIEINKDLPRDSD